MGDVNSDWYFGKKDIEIVVDYIMGREPQKFDFFQADMNGDGKVDAADLVLITTNRWDK